jgi:hypothetical protein
MIDIPRAVTVIVFALRSAVSSRRSIRPAA